MGLGKHTIAGTWKEGDNSGELQDAKKEGRTRPPDSGMGLAGVEVRLPLSKLCLGGII